MLFAGYLLTEQGAEPFFQAGGNIKIRPRKACNYPNLRSFEWVSYDKVGVLHSGKLGNRSEARASDLSEEAIRGSGGIE